MREGTPSKAQGDPDGRIIKLVPLGYVPDFPISRSNVHADVQRLIGHGLVDKQPYGLVWVPWADVVVKLDASLLSAA